MYSLLHRLVKCFIPRIVIRSTRAPLVAPPRRRRSRRPRDAVPWKRVRLSMASRNACQHQVHIQIYVKYKFKMQLNVNTIRHYLPINKHNVTYANTTTGRPWHVSVISGGWVCYLVFQCGSNIDNHMRRHDIT